MLKKIKSTLLNHSKKTTCSASHYDYSFGLKELTDWKHQFNNYAAQNIIITYEQLELGNKTCLIDGFCFDEKNRIHIEWFFNTYPTNYLANLLQSCLFLQNEETSPKKQLQAEEIELLLNKSIQDNPDSVESYSRKIILANYLNNPNLALSSFNDVKSINAKHLGAHFNYYDYLKRTGLDAASFAIETGERNKTNLLHSVFLKYVIDEAVEQKNNLSSKEAKRYLKDKYQKKLETLYESFNEKLFKSNHQIYYLHNYYAFLFSLLGNPYLRERELRKMKNNLTQYPWINLNINSMQHINTHKLYGFWV